MHRAGQRASAGLGGLLGLGAGLATYAFVEPRRRRLVVKDVPLPRLSEGDPIEVLHVSDAHIGRRGHGDRSAFLASIPGRLERTPDLVISTGDMIEMDAGIDPLLEALEPFRARWGKFYVNGSHDLYQPHFQSYAKYWRGRQETVLIPSDIERLEKGLRDLGWTALTNREETVETPAGRVRLSGVDDPYLNRHRTDHIRSEPDDLLRIGVMHAPDVVSDFSLAGFDLMLAGHTHGGQVRFPFVGALVTNCSLPAELAMGLHRIGNGCLHVSPGLGQGTFSPIRFLARPEATLLRLGT